LAGIGWLFFDGRSVGGWILTATGALIILAGIIANLHIYFAPTSVRYAGDAGAPGGWPGADCPIVSSAAMSRRRVNGILTQW
jgi:hypothetical protein